MRLQLSARSAVALASAALLGTLVPAGTGVAGMPSAHRASPHYACSGPNSAKKPCQFSTPSSNIRCLWTPASNTIMCELLKTGRGYSLRPTGKAKAIRRLTLRHRGETLPTNQQLLFPQSMSCHDTKTTMTCNQDFGLGFFKVAPKGSKSR